MSFSVVCWTWQAGNTDVTWNSAERANCTPTLPHSRVTMPLSVSLNSKSEWNWQKKSQPPKMTVPSLPNIWSLGAWAAIRLSNNMPPTPRMSVSHSAVCARSCQGFSFLEKKKIKGCQNHFQGGVWDVRLLIRRDGMTRCLQAPIYWEWLEVIAKGLMRSLRLPWKSCSNFNLGRVLFLIKMESLNQIIFKNPF